MSSIPLDKNNIETNDILIDFQCMYDFDVSAVRYLVGHAKNAKLINWNILNASSLSGLRNLLLFRTLENPLSVCIAPEYFDSIDSLYKELIKKHEQEILNDCEVNYLHSYINLLLKSKDLVSVTVNCENELQADIVIKSMNSKAKIVINERNLADYDTLYLKYASSIIQYKNIHKKRIFILNGLYNFKKGMFREEILLLINNNIVNVVDQYKNLTIPAFYNLFINLNKESVIDDQRNKNESVE